MTFHGRQDTNTIGLYRIGKCIISRARGLLIYINNCFTFCKPISPDEILLILSLELRIVKIFSTPHHINSFIFARPRKFLDSFFFFIVGQKV